MEKIKILDYFDCDEYDVADWNRIAESFLKSK